MLDSEGNPICTELWPGKAADVKSLLPVVDRLKRRFPVEEVCIVADRGMISAASRKNPEHPAWRGLSAGQRPAPRSALEPESSRAENKSTFSSAGNETYFRTGLRRFMYSSYLAGPSFCFR